MKTIYLDSDFRCHVTDDGTMTAVETDAFDGYCDTYIEGYRFVPVGKTFIREDGTVFKGEMIAPVTDWNTLDAAQGVYEREQYKVLIAENAEYEASLAELDAAYKEGVDSL